MDEETISLATLRAYLWYAANMDIFLQSIALSAFMGTDPFCSDHGFLFAYLGELQAGLSYLYPE